MDISVIVKSWINSSNENFETMNYLYQSKRYNWALFLGHLTIEKLLKAYYVKINSSHSPYIHNLLRLAELSRIKLSKDQRKDLATITTFNINARYDDYKLKFYRKCTKEYTNLWIKKIKEYRVWIIELIK